MYFLIYSHNQIVLGKEKSAIYDLENSTVLYIPNIMVEILEMMRVKTITSIKKEYTPNNPNIIDNYLKLFLRNRLGFYTKDPELFPKIEPMFHYPGILQSAVLESDLAKYDLLETLNDLDSLGCRYLEIRLLIKDIKQWEKLSEILSVLKSSIFVSKILIIKYKSFINEQMVIDTLKRYPKISKVIVYSANKTINVSEDITFTINSIDILEKYDINNPKLIVNTNYFTESLNFNTTYNKKVAINFLGHIKNILKDDQVYGNVNENKLTTIVHSKDFQKWWGYQSRYD